MAREEAMLHFLGGVSGAGKTTLLEGAIASGVPLRRVSGGELIAAGRQSMGAYRRPEVKHAGEAAENQELLLAGLREALLNSEGTQSIVLDGHFVVPSEAGFVSLKSEVFRRMRPSSLLLLRAAPAEVERALRSRTRLPRWWDGCRESLERFCEVEERTAMSVARELDVELVAFSRADGFEPLARVLRARRDS